jgi:hypothetical protein
VQSVPSYDEVERAIRSVPGVAAATVTRAEDTGRGRLRIRLRPGEDPERVSWSVAATLRERFDIAMDPDEIRPRLTSAPDDDEVCSTSPDAGTHRDDEGPVLMMDHGSNEGDEQRETTRAPARGPAGATCPPVWRAAIRDLNSRNDGLTVSVTASLELDGRLAAGEAQGAPTARGLRRAIAEATVRALSGLTDQPLRAQVDRVTVSDADPMAVTVLVSFVSSRGEELLLGGSIVRDDVEHAVMRATLDALNRRVQPDLAV